MNNKPQKSEALPPWYFNRTQKEICKILNESIDLIKLSALWKNPEFHVEQIGDVLLPKTWDPGFSYKHQENGFLIYLSYEEVDSKDMKTVTRFTTRKWYLEANVSDDNIERTTFKMLSNSLEHRLGEFYIWKKHSIRSPHIPLEDLIKNSHESHMETLQKRMKSYQKLIELDKEIKSQTEKLEKIKNELLNHD